MDVMGWPDLRAEMARAALKSRAVAKHLEMKPQVFSIHMNADREGISRPEPAFVQRFLEAVSDLSQRGGQQ